MEALKWQALVSPSAPADEVLQPHNPPYQQGALVLSTPKRPQPLHERDDGESHSQFFKQIGIHKHTVKLKPLLGRVLEHLFTKRSSQLLSVYSGAGTVRNIYTQERISFILTTSL